MESLNIEATDIFLTLISLASLKSLLAAKGFILINRFQINKLRNFQPFYCCS